MVVSGLHQGNPLSLYLFIICVEGFSTILNEAMIGGRMKGVLIGKEKFAINHLFFADDCVLFGKALKERAQVVQDIITKYENASGQKVNYYKSLIYFGGNVNSDVRTSVENQLGVRISLIPKKFLGLPMMIGRGNKQAFTYYIDRVYKKVVGWGMCFLFMGGKEVFIKSLLVYAMQYFLFSKGLCLQLKNILNKFQWRNNKT